MSVTAQATSGVAAQTATPILVVNNIEVI